MTNRIEVTFPDAARVREYAKNKGFRSVQEMIVHAVKMHMNQYKDKRPQPDKEFIRELIKEVLNEEKQNTYK